MNLPEESTSRSISTLSAQPRWRRWLVPTVVTIHALLFIRLWHACRIPYESLPAWMDWMDWPFKFSLVAHLLEVCFLAQPFLLSAWLIWGRTHFAVRLCVFAAFPWAVLWCIGGYEASDMASNLGGVHFVCVIPIVTIGFMRLIGYQFVDLRSPMESRPYQFSIRQLLLISFVFGAWLSVLRWSIDGQWKSLLGNISHNSILDDAGIQLLATAALVAGLMDGKRVRLILVLGLLGMALPNFDERLRSDYVHTLKVALATSANVLFSVLLVRLAGYRLRRATPT